MKKLLVMLVAILAICTARAETHLERIIGYGNIEKVLFSPDGVKLASCGGSIFIWDISTGDTIFSIRGHTGFDNSFAFSPDGSIIVSTSKVTATENIDVSDLSSDMYYMVLQSCRQSKGKSFVVVR